MIEQLLLARRAIGEGEERFKLAAGWIHAHHLLNGGKVFEKGRQAQVDACGGRFPAQEVGQGDREDADKAVETNSLVGPIKLRLPVQPGRLPHIPESVFQVPGVAIRGDKLDGRPAGLAGKEDGLPQCICPQCISCLWSMVYVNADRPAASGSPIVVRTQSRTGVAANAIRLRKGRHNEPKIIRIDR